MRPLPLLPRSQRRDVDRVQDSASGLPVSLQQTLVSRLQQHVGEAFPQGQTRRISEQTLAEHVFGDTQSPANTKCVPSSCASAVTASTIL